MEILIYWLSDITVGVNIFAWLIVVFSGLSVWLTGYLLNSYKRTPEKVYETFHDTFVIFGDTIEEQVENLTKLHKRVRIFFWISVAIIVFLPSSETLLMMVS